MWDQKIADTAAAIRNCESMGGVVLKPKPRPTGFTR